MLGQVIADGQKFNNIEELEQWLEEHNAYAILQKIHLDCMTEPFHDWTVTFVYKDVDNFHNKFPDVNANGKRIKFVLENKNVRLN